MARRVLTEEADNKWIKCREGWVKVSKMASGKFHISASGHNQHIVSAEDLHHHLEDLITRLGGRARG